MKSSLGLLIPLFLLFVAGCDNSTDAPVAIVQTDTGEPAFSIPLPEGLTPRRALDLEQLVLELKVNGRAIEMAPNAERTQWSGSISLPENEEFVVSVDWLESGTRLSTMSNTYGPLTENTQLTLLAEDYETEQFDEDSDGHDNLSEIINDFNLNDPDNPGTRDQELVVIPWIPPAEAPVMDGLYDTTWNNSVFVDIEGQTLSIDNLMIDQGSTLRDGEPDYQWSALYDGIYLYLLVFGEAVEGATLFADSDDMNDDDAISIFLDGNDSKSGNYDGADDYHMIIPLQKYPPTDGDGKETNGTNSTNYRIQAGENSAALPTIPEDIQFIACVCENGRHLWEVRIKLEAVNIEAGRPFGIEVQLHDDINGDTLDAKWGWKHPSRMNNEDVDDTRNNPSLMGTATLFRVN